LCYAPFSPIPGGSKKSKLIFPNLNPNDKIKVNSLKSERGNIYDRNGELLAGEGVVASVGFVPGKMGEDKETDI